ncbi:hypothetical protein [Diaminobutyricimonas aerilata]|uniref:MmyB family transcriptional regulator n=1 Tax=Diaminobutyricimonas aerilata TaxID=1162967 RepID=UPI0012FD07C5|nr:hypothetical protein [Diaminobutyricimonas aerilata]
MVLTSGLLVVDANRRWRALHLPFAERGDLAQMVFTDPAAASFYADLRHEEYDVVALLLDAVADERTRSEAEAAVDRLRERSARFDRLWAGPRVRPRLLDTYAVRHPDLGDVAFARRTVRGDGLVVRVSTPHPASARLLPLLDHLPV